MDIEALLAYLDRSPSPRHAVESSIRLLEGFVRLDEETAWESVPAAGYVVRGGALIAWVAPEQGHATTPFHIVGAHTDSPCLRVKPRPDASVLGWRQLGVEVYGGILNNSWLDRDLGVAGYVVDADGRAQLVDVHHPIARVPQLAVHLDREVNSVGLRLDPQTQLTPVWGTGQSSLGDFAEWIGDAAGLDVAPTWWELSLYDVQPATVLGADGSLMASGRIDNLLSCWAATSAVTAAQPTDHWSMIVLNDHEEVGSSSTSGAAGPFLEVVLDRLIAARSPGSRANVETRSQIIATSSCVSVDNAHAVHPNYVERHEPDHRPMVNGGPAIKVNSNQRYATSAQTAQLFQRSCEAVNVPWQVFVSRNNMPCGSTIGPATSTRLGISTVDVGVPQLSMHSARELCGAEDPIHLRTALTHYLS